MCGIFGIISKVRRNQNIVRKGFVTLAKLSESRGKDSSGIVYRDESQREFNVIKGAIPLNQLLGKNAFSKKIFNYLDDSHTVTIMGHSRLVTNGSQLNEKNNQPVVKDGIIAIHNGIIVNVDELWDKNNTLERTSDIDTEVMLALIAHRIKLGLSLESAISSTLKDVVGTVSAAFLFNNINEFVLSSNNGSLYFLYDNSGCLAFASEEYFLKRLTKEVKGLFPQGSIIRKVDNGKSFILNLETFRLNEFELNSQKEDQILSYIHKPYEIKLEVVSDTKTQRELILDPTKIIVHPNASSESKELQFNIDSIKTLRRCVKCILPETFPFIHFDQNGICNYCKNYILKCKNKPIEELFNLVKPYRRNNGEYDCIIPYSGGRDSTHTLHIAKNVLNLNPIAFTYDWGMVNDLARRNIARVCGKLGVENIIVSANIAWKRENIRKNIKAWLKQPDLGMIPLFMAGDKYFYYFTDQIKRQTGIRLNIWGINPLENTDFKVGFLGVPPDHEKERIYSLSRKRQGFLFKGIIKNISANPSYLNSSVFDTIGSFISRSLIPHRDYYHLYDYYRWNEKEIENLVLEEYLWERAIDTKSTWRIGDGTAAFYNYIYFTVAGFSEYDTFRSNQIREGMITRERALELVYEENKPRYVSIKWYTEILNLDFIATIKVINNIRKLYTIY